MALLDGYRSLGGIGTNGECLPAQGNRLTLADETNAIGLGRARVDFTYGPDERAIEVYARKTLGAIWEAAGARDVFAVARSAHTIGTCRMELDPDCAVVDPGGRSFDVPGLFVCDNSIFPSSLAANPALTITALALRTADRFLGRGA